MTEFMDAETKEQVRGIFAGLSGPVRLVFFTQKHPCATCREQQDLLTELAGLSPKVTLEVHDREREASLAAEYGIDKVPATAIAGARDHGIRFYGVTSGYEFGSLLEDIVMVSTGDAGLDENLKRLVALIDEPLHLEIMVTLTCPYCPRMVRVAHQIAFVNEHIRAEMVEAAEFPELVQRYDVHGVPRTVINGRPAFEGALPAQDAILQILKVVKPRKYEEIEAAVREASGERHAVDVQPKREYDLLVVGAGPAAWTAAMYAARKALDVGLIGDELGGQMHDTATIENWPGMAEVSGDDLADAFRMQAERYPIADRLHARVTRIEHTEEGTFELATEDKRTYRSRAVIYAAGSQYRRLGVRGESQYIGRGIGFCATCDAPLYRDKRVAVVGGGNSAFTAARDLLSYAREIHIINIVPDFQADAALVEEVRTSSKVVLHPATRVLEFLGEGQLKGVRLEAVDGSVRTDLLVDGVFLEIGLVPNSAPLEGLLGLTLQREVPVGRDQSTEVPGLFAAGDVTDEPEKQIVVAAAAGAKAALAAHRYLLEAGRKEMTKVAPQETAAAPAAAVAGR